MSGLWLHCRLSKDRTGKDYKSLHTWIDEPCQKYGVNHRKERHAYNLEEAAYIRKEFGGEQAVIEWLFHIMIDNLETSFKISKALSKEQKPLNFYKFGLLQDSRFILFDVKSLCPHELDEEFKSAYKQVEVNFRKRPLKYVRNNSVH